MRFVQPWLRPSCDALPAFVLVALIAGTCTTACNDGEEFNGDKSGDCSDDAVGRDNSACVPDGQTGVDARADTPEADIANDAAPVDATVDVAPLDVAIGGPDARDAPPSQYDVMPHDLGLPDATRSPDVQDASFASDGELMDPDLAPLPVDGALTDVATADAAPDAQWADAGAENRPPSFVGPAEIETERFFDVFGGLSGGRTSIRQDAEDLDGDAVTATWLIEDTGTFYRGWSGFIFQIDGIAWKLMDASEDFVGEEALFLMLADRPAQNGTLEPIRVQLYLDDDNHDPVLREFQL